MVKFGERIRALAQEIGKDEQDVAKDLGLTKSRLSHYISGRSKVPSELLQEIVDTYKINPLFLFDENASLYNVVKEEEPLYKLNNEYYFLPTSISAGLPLDVESVTNAETIRIPDEIMGKWAGDKNIFFTKTNGDSMDRIIPDKSLIAIKPTPLELLKNGDIVVYSCDGEYSVKHYHRYGDTLVFTPNSTNTEHKEHQYSIEEEVKLHGKVVISINVHD